MQAAVSPAQGHPLKGNRVMNTAPIRASIEVTTRSRLDERTRAVRIKKQPLTIKLYPNQGEHQVDRRVFVSRVTLGAAALCTTSAARTVAATSGGLTGYCAEASGV